MKVLVIGTGFLGLEILKVLKFRGHDVVGARRNLDNSQNFSMISIDVGNPSTFSNIPKDIDAIVYNVSASASDESSYKHAYSVGVKNIINFATDNLSKSLKFVLVSSTGVYQENFGDKVDEESRVLLEDKKYCHILDGENEVLRSFENTGLVLRFSGIYGKGRDYFLNFAKNTEIMSQKDIKWTNRIHKVDGANVVSYLLEKGACSVYNVSDLCPSINIDCYSFIRQYLGLSKLDCVEANLIVNSGKQIFPNKLINTGFSFQYPSYREGYGEILDG